MCFSKMSQRLIDDSEVVQMLKSGLITGKIDSTATEKQLCSSNAKNQCFKLGTICTRLKRVKRELEDNKVIHKSKLAFNLYF